MNNIINLEKLNDKLKETIIELKNIFDKIDKEKEELKLNVQKIFTRLRTVIKEREDELSNDIDKIINDKFFDENLLKEGEKSPNKIKASMKKVKVMDKEWDEINLNKYINNCITIENDIEKINDINQQINKCIGNEEAKIQFCPDDNGINDMLEKIKSFGNIVFVNNSFFQFSECPQGLSDIRKYLVSGEHKNIITKTGKGGDFAGTICQNPLDIKIEIHRWKIKILKTKGKEINIGIASNDFNQNSPHWNKGYFLYCKNSTLYSMTFSGKNKNIKKVEDEVL